MRYSLAKLGLLWLVSAEAIGPALALVARPGPGAVNGMSITPAANTPARRDAVGGDGAEELVRRGLAAAQARYLLLTSRLADLQYQAAYYKAVLAAPNSSPSTQIQAERELARVRKVYAATYAELESVASIIKANIDKTFKIFP